MGKFRIKIFPHFRKSEQVFPIQIYSDIGKAADAFDSGFGQAVSDAQAFKTNKAGILQITGRWMPVLIKATTSSAFQGQRKISPWIFYRPVIQNRFSNIGMAPAVPSPK